MAPAGDEGDVVGGGLAGADGGGRSRQGRKRRGLVRVLVGAVIALSVAVAVAVVALAAVSRTGAGRELALQWALSRVGGLTGGAVRVGSVGHGGLLAGASFRDVRVEDALGRPVLVVDSVRAGYSIAQLLGRGWALADVDLFSPVLTLDPGHGEAIASGARGPGAAGGADTGIPALPGLPAPVDSVGGQAPRGTADGESALRIRRARIHDGVVVLRDTGEPLAREIDIEAGGIEWRAGGQPLAVADVREGSLSYLPGPGASGSLDLRGIRGTVLVDDAGVRIEMDRFRLPGTRGRGWVLARSASQGGGQMMDIRFTEVALPDFRWLDDRLDHGVARGDVRLTLADGPGGRDVRLQLEQVRLQTGQGGDVLVSGAASLGADVRFHDLRVSTGRLESAEAERWLGPAPAGRPLTSLWPSPTALAGALSLDGSWGRLAIAGDVALVEMASGDTVAHLSGAGTRRAAGGLENVSLQAHRLEYALLGSLAPSVPWGGTGSASLEADGDLARGLRVSAVARHRPLAGAAHSTVTASGVLFGDTAVRSLELDVTLDPLGLDMLHSMGLREGAEWMGALTGALAGSLSLSGRLDSLALAASLDALVAGTGPETASDTGTRQLAGTLSVAGVVDAGTFAGPHAVQIVAQDLRLDRVLASLSDSVRVSGQVHVRSGPSGVDSARLALNVRAGPSMLGRVRLDSGEARILLGKRGELRIDTVRVDVAGVLIEGRGILGAGSGMATEGVRLQMSAPSIHRLRPLVMAGNPVAWDQLTDIQREVMIEFDGVDPDTFPSAESIRFDGSVDGTIRLDGGLGDLSVRATLGMDDPTVGLFQARAAELEVAVAGLRVPLPGLSEPGEPEIPGRTVSWEGRASAESLSVSGRTFESATLEGSFETGVGGRAHALVVRSGAAGGRAREAYEILGSLELDGEGWSSGSADLERLDIRLPERRWSLAQPATLRWSPDAWIVRDLAIAGNRPEALSARARGRLARGGGESDFELSVARLDLASVAGILQLDDAPQGTAFVDLTATGAQEARRWEGRVRVDSPVLGNLAFDQVRASGAYGERRVRGRMEAWTGGRASVTLEGSVPLDLGLREVEERVPDEPIDVVAVLDSLPARMALLPMPMLEEVDGAIGGRVRLEGRPASLSYDGRLEIEDASARIEALGVRLVEANVQMGLRPDGTVTVSGSGASGSGAVQVAGTMDASQPADPIFDLAFWPREFQVVDRRDMRAAVTGDSVTLTGSFRYPLIEGALDVVDGTVYMEEFQRTREAVDFYDPQLFQAATALIGSDARASGDAVRSRSAFLRNLRVLVDMNVNGGWLRSRTMNVETDGALSLTFDRQGNRLILDGEVEVVRGTYALGPRTLRMTDGSFQFVGTPGFNPGVAVTAETRLRTREGQPLVITADISGTLLSPSLSLSSDAESAMSEADLINYIVLGRPTSALAGDGGAVSIGGRNLLLGQVFNELGYLLALELDLDHLSVSQAEQGQANAAFGTSSLQLEVGWYVWDNVFLTGVYQRGFCADPTLPASSGGFRVEVGMPRDVMLEGFLEGQCTRQSYRGLGGHTLELAPIWGFSLFREWGY